MAKKEGISQAKGESEFLKTDEGAELYKQCEAEVS